MTRIAGTAACGPRSAEAFLSSMRVVLLLVTSLLGSPALTWAQVTVDLHALDALPQSAPTPRPPHRPLPRRPMPPAPNAALVPQAEASSKSTPVPPPGVAANVPPNAAPAPRVEASNQALPLPSVATSPPPPAIALPSEAPAPAALPTQPAAPTPEPPQPRTLRVGFAPGQSDLTGLDAGAIARLGQAVPRTGAIRVEVLAYAPTTNGDASAARRLSLARALAVRSALMGAGVPTTSITVRALGSPPAEQAGAANTAVVTVMGTSGAAAPKQGNQP